MVEQYAATARRWFTDGWTTDPAMADEIFSPAVTTNGRLVGIDGPKGRIQDRLRGFPDLATEIGDIVTAGDQLTIRLTWRGTHTGPYGGLPPTGKTVEVRDMAIWRFDRGLVQEIWTLQDQFALLQQVGYFPDGIYEA